MNKSRWLDHKFNNALQSVVLIGSMMGLLALLGWILAGVDGLVWTTLLGLLTLALSPRMAPGVILRMYGARELHPGIAPGLFALFDELARRAGLSAPPRIFHLPSRALNAFALGDRQNPVVAVSDALLRSLAPREIAGVLAHELSHIRNNDMWVMGLADTVTRLTGLLANAGFILLLLSLPLVLTGLADIALLPLLLLMAAPTLSALLQLALSRTREYDADLNAAMLTGDPQGLASALYKLERYQGGWLEQVLLPGHRVPEPSLLRTHPPTAERVRRLMALMPEPRPLRHARDPYLAIDLPRIQRRPRWHIGGVWY